MPEEVAVWKGRSEAPLSGFGIRCLLFVYRWLGRGLSRFFAALVLLVCYPFLRAARHASADYREHWSAFTGRRYPGGGFGHIRHFCFSMLDRLACWGGIFPQERIKVRTPEMVERITQDFCAGKGAFFVLAHLGNAELLRAIFLPLAQKYGRHLHVYIDVSPTQQFNAMVQAINSESGISLHSALELGVGSSIAMAEAIEKGDFIIMAGDRCTRAGERACSTQAFMGGKAEFPRGTFRLASALSCPVYTLFLLAEGSRYDLYTHLVSDGSASAAEITTRFITHLESACTDYPQEWFNFYPFWKTEG